MIKTVFLDIDNTLLDFNECANVSAQKAFRDLNLTYHEGVFPVFTEENDKLWLKIEDGTITREELHRVRWQLIFDRLQIDADGILMEKQFKHYINTVAITIDYANEILEYLSSKYKVYATSNATYEQQISRLKNADFDKYFSGYFISERVGFEKPSKEFFDGCFSSLPYSVDEVTMIGDSPTADIKGGVKYGLDTIWFNHRGESLPDDIKPKFTVNHLKEIENIL